MNRRCVICGCEQTTTQNDCNATFHYPKSKKEAKIWQKSLNASNVPLEVLQKYCCICTEHLPVEQTPNNQKERKENKEDKCGCPMAPPEISKPPVNILLMTGASLPTYCQGKFKEDIKCNAADNDDSDGDICVLESNFIDCGKTFPDIDETEIHFMRTFINDDKEEDSQSDNDDKSDVTCPEAKTTDVLLLAKVCSKDLCPCTCDKCEEEKGELKPCCPVGCEAETPMRYNQPPCGCECEQMVRQELNKIIEEQRVRIRILEKLITKQLATQENIVNKVDELHQEIHSLHPTPPEKQGNGEASIKEMKLPTTTGITKAQSIIVSRNVKYIDAKPKKRKLLSLRKLQHMITKSSKQKEL